MPKVSTQVAGKDYPDLGIKKGDTYYSWAFFRGPTIKSKVYPKPSQLTQSKWSGVYAAQEALEGADPTDGLSSALERAASDVEEIGSEYMDADEAMGSNGGPNQEKADHLDGLSSELQDLQGQAEEAEEELSDARDLVERVAQQKAGEDVDQDLAQDLAVDVGAKWTAEQLEEAESAAEAKVEEAIDKLNEIHSEAMGLDWDSPC